MDEFDIKERYLMQTFDMMDSMDGGLVGPLVNRWMINERVIEAVNRIDTDDCQVKG